MVVACQQCGTRFNLDESLITRDIVKVRCSHCQHVFTVTRPEDRPELLGETAEREEETPRPAGLDAPVGEEAEAPAPQVEPEALAPGEAGEPAGRGVEAASLQDDPTVSPPESAKSRPKRMERAVIISIVSGCLLGLLLGMIALWYAGGKTATSPVSQTGRERPSGSLAPPLPPASPEELRNLMVGLKDARYKGLVHAKGGQLLVIQGEVRNYTGEPRGPIRLQATLTDSLNQPVQELLFYSGTSVSDEELLQADPEEIKRWLAKPGGREGIRVVRPGDSQVFTAVFFGVPDNLAEARHGFNIVVIAGPRVPAE